MRPLVRIVAPGILLLSSLLLVVSAIGSRRIESQFPPIGRFVTIHGIRLHYTDQGSGPPIVLIHGASSNLMEFQQSLVPGLARHHRVLVFDRPGYGYSERPEGPWPDPRALASLLLDACASMEVTRPVLVGHSWAGSVVMAALLHEPARVAGGVLLAGVAGHWVGARSVTERLGDVPALNAVFAHTLLYPIGSLVLPAALESVFAPHPVPAGHAERAGTALSLRPGTYLHNAQDMNRLSEFLQRQSSSYDSITGNLLVIHGTRDEVVPFWNHGKRLRPLIGGIEVVLMEGHGHALHQVDPIRVGGLIHDFARRISERPGGIATAPLPAGSQSVPGRGVAAR